METPNLQNPQYPISESLRLELQSTYFDKTFNKALLDLSENLYGERNYGYEEVWTYSSGYLARKIVRLPELGVFTGSELCYEAATLGYFGMSHLVNIGALQPLKLDILLLHLDFDAINLGSPFYKKDDRPHCVLLINDDTVLDFTSKQVDPRRKSNIRFFNLNSPPNSYRIASGMMMLITESQLATYESKLVKYAQPVSDIQLLFELLVS